MGVWHCLPVVFGLCFLGAKVILQVFLLYLSDLYEGTVKSLTEARAFIRIITFSGEGVGVY